MTRVSHTTAVKLALLKDMDAEEEYRWVLAFSGPYPWSVSIADETIDGTRRAIFKEDGIKQRNSQDDTFGTTITTCLDWGGASTFYFEHHEQGLAVSEWMEAIKAGELDSVFRHKTKVSKDSCIRLSSSHINSSTMSTLTKATPLPLPHHRRYLQRHSISGFRVEHGPDTGILFDGAPYNVTKSGVEDVESSNLHKFHDACNCYSDC